jgi:hypothetical protein
MNSDLRPAYPSQTHLPTTVGTHLQYMWVDLDVERNQVCTFHVRQTPHQSSWKPRRGERKIFNNSIIFQHYNILEKWFRTLPTPLHDVQLNLDSGRSSRLYLPMFQVWQIRTSRIHLFLTLPGLFNSTSSNILMMSWDLISTMLGEPHIDIRSRARYLPCNLAASSQRRGSYRLTCTHLAFWLRAGGEFELQTSSWI